MTPPPHPQLGADKLFFLHLDEVAALSLPQWLPLSEAQNMLMEKLQVGRGGAYGARGAGGRMGERIGQRVQPRGAGQRAEDGDRSQGRSRARSVIERATRSLQLACARARSSDAQPLLLLPPAPALAAAQNSISAQQMDALRATMDATPAEPVSAYGVATSLSPAQLKTYQVGAVGVVGP